MGLQRCWIAQGLGVQPLVLFFGSTSNPTPHTLFSCVALVMSFSRDTSLELQGEVTLHSFQNKVSPSVDYPGGGCRSHLGDVQTVLPSAST